MTEAKIITNRLKQAWSVTNNGNWDNLQYALKNAKKEIDNGNVDKELVDAYLVISEAFNKEFGGRS